MKRCLAGLALLPALALAQGPAACTEGIEEALRSVAPKARIDGEVVARDCKPWPGSSGRQTAAVMAFDAPSTPRGWVIVLALVDSRSERLIASRSTGLEEDATTSLDASSLSLDTARYQVRPALRALGLRFRSAARQPSAAEAWWGNELMLFVPEGRTLRPVFGRSMSAQQSESGVLNYNYPGSIWNNAEMTLAVGPTAATGWNDLVITETLTRDGVEGTTFDATPRRRQYVYRYDGKAYHLLANPAPFWDGYCCSLAW